VALLKKYFKKAIYKQISDLEYNFVFTYKPTNEEISIAEEEYLDLLTKTQLILRS